VPYVNMPRVSTTRFEEYETLICKKQGSLPAAEVDRLLTEGETEFMARARFPNWRAAPEGAPVPVEDDEEQFFR